MLEIKKTDNDTVELNGRLDASQCEKASEELQEINGSITIDMSGLNYISSSGLSVLLKTYKRLEEKGETMKLIKMDDHIRDVFRLTRLDQFFDVE